MSRRIDVEADDVLQLLGELRIAGELEAPHPMWGKPVRLPDALHRGGADARGLRHRRRRLVRRVCVGERDHAVDHVSAGSGGMRDGRVLSRASPSTPACMNRSCQRQMAVLSLPTARTMPFVPMPSAVNKNDPRPPQTCF